MKGISSRHRHVEELVGRHQATVRGFLLYLGCPASQLDDLIQDVFLSLLSSDFEDRDDAVGFFLR